MCGILAALYNKQAFTGTQLILFNRGFKTLQTRGPDDYQVIQTSRFIMGFTRLCINDLSPVAMQPFISKDKTIHMVCNGEIYNCKELIQQYNLTCDSSSDCEVVLHLYKRIGFEKMIKVLDGVFAIILIHDTITYVARDRFGVRPLFVGTSFNGTVSFGSTAKSLLPWSSNVQQLVPGIYKYNSSERVSKKKWMLPQREVKSTLDMSVKYIHDVLIDAHRKRLQTDRPIASFLSGGIDSSVCVAILCKLLGPKNVRTYSIGMEGSVDLKYARKVAIHLGTQHHEITFTPQQGLNAIPQVIKHLETYDVTTIRAGTGMYLLSKYIKAETGDVVIFSGEGADELLGGYLYFHHAPSVKKFVGECIRLQKELYVYDVLRADRMVSSNGLELRVPFLDRDVVDLINTIPGDQKIPNKKLGGYEKYILRVAFQDYLPKSVVWRRKCAFSDGVSSSDNSWYKMVQNYANANVSDKLFKDSGCHSKEECYYKNTFNMFFPRYDLNVQQWLPRWVNCKDPSARVFYTGLDKSEM